MAGQALHTSSKAPGPMYAGWNGKWRSFAEADRTRPAAEQARREWEARRKLKNDPRVTSVGAVLRSTSIDELPQLLNVLPGELSIVGPRPVVQDELRRYGEHSAHYCSARSCLTGLRQVSGRNDVSYDARVNFDRMYCENWSLTGDLVLMARTVPAVLPRKGTY